MRIALCCLLLLATSVAAAQECPWWAPPPFPDLQGFDRVLIPIYNAPVRGAYGTTWTSTVRAFNESENPVCLFPKTTVFLIGPVALALSPRTASDLLFYEPSAGPRVPPTPSPVSARILYVDKRFSDSIAIRSSVRSGRIEVEIPTVRDRDLRSQIILAAGVRHDPARRMHLRIYAMTPGEWTSARVRLLDEHSGLVRDETEVDISPGNMLIPGYAEITDFLRRFPNMAPPNRGLARFDIEISALSPNTRLWAFLTVTDNESQYVTVISPR